MDCRKFESQLELFLAEELPPALMLECRAHLESCPACRALMDLAKRELIQVEPARTEEFIQAVLEKTSGKGCAQAYELLPDYVDGVLATASRELIEQHLRNCHSCHQICRTMKELNELLPGLAQIDPGNSFTRECMHSFSQAQNQRAQLWIWPGRIWGRLFARPRLAWESAYVLTLLLFVLLKLGTFVPGLSPAATIGTLQTKSAQIGVFIADAFKKNINDWSLSVTDRRYRWAKSSSMRKEEVFSSIVLVKDKTKQYSRSTSNAVIQLPHSIWNGIAGKAEKILPKDRATT